MMELLSPAGHWEAMVAAVQNGADAVYFGCGGFNARRGAKNFSPEELDPAVAYCHLRGVKVYLTVNTLVTDRELDAAGDLLRRASRAGVDGVIVQDWGLAALARRIVPDLPLHGSTQMTVHSLAGVEAAARLGMDCVVLSREVSREDMARICRRGPIKIEVFAHGALCMCYSGQCAMSALIGGRSGNRGACAQPCRLPYRLDEGRTGHPLSLKDACLVSHLRELRDMGVSILKLEGRMKRPEYVAVMTRIYARLLREDRLPTPEDLRELELAFSRQGFTDDYWRGRPGPQMFGVRPEGERAPEELFRAAKAAYSREESRTAPVVMEAAVLAGQPARLTVTDGQGRTAAAQGPVPEEARTRPLTAESLEERLAKTGGTVFRAERVRVQVDEGLSLPASAVNALRREALDGLAALRQAPPQRRESDPDPLPPAETPPGPMAFTVSLFDPGQLTAGLLDLSPAIVYLPAERIGEFDLSPYAGGRTEFCAVLPRVCVDHERGRLTDLLRRALDRGCASAALGTLGQGEIAREAGFTVLRGDLGLNLFNSRSLLEARDWGLRSAAVSFELRWEQIRDLRKYLPCEAVVYGRLPLMLTENCLVANGLGCRSRDLRGPCRAGHVLTDRRGEAFPILPAFGCRSELQNSKVLFLADKPELGRCGLTYGRLRFTTETAADCARLLSLYQTGKGAAPEGFTRGLFYRGVE